MDRILRSVQSARRGLRLRPRDELVKELEVKAEELEGLPEGSFPPYVLEAAREAIRDLREADTEEEVVRRAAVWMKGSLADADRARRALRTQLGSLILTADVGDTPRVTGRHDWKDVPNNDLNSVCGNCGIVGFRPSWDPGRIRAPYDCDQFTRLTADRVNDV